MPHKWHLSIDAQRLRYRQHENTIDNAGYVERFHRLISLLREKTPEARRILDYGCGHPSVFVDLLKSAGYEAVGYDPLFAPNARLAPAFDAVVSVETFEHFADPANDLARIASLLHPGGILAIMTLFHRGPESLEDWWYVRDPTHVSFYSPATIRFISEAYGFTPLLIDDKSIAFLLKREE